MVVDLLAVEYDDAEGGTQLYQLPLACYPAPQERLGHALVGLLEDDEDLDTCYLYDAVHDREAMAGYLRSFAVAEGAGAIVFHRMTGHDLDLSTHSTLMSAEQSNSSVAFGEDALLKVFRRLTPGVNPDIAIHEVLTRAGSDRIAALYGWVEAPSPTEPDGPPLQLAMLQQFLRTASDGWELALASVRNLFAEADLHADEVGGDFAAEAARLGEAVSSVHHDLAEHFDTGTVDLAARGRPDERPAGRGDRRRPRAGRARGRAPLGLRPAGRARQGAGAAGARRPPPGPDPAYRQGLEDRGLRG